MDGKTAVVPDHINTWEVKTYNGALVPMTWQFPPGQVQIAPSIQVDSHLYHRTPHTHPDGSVFFEWSKPKGTKTGVKKAKKPKLQKVNWNITTSNSATFTPSQMRAYYGATVQNPRDAIKLAKP